MNKNIELFKKLANLTEYWYFSYEGSKRLSEELGLQAVNDAI